MGRSILVVNILFAADIKVTAFTAIAEASVEFLPAPLI